jgi:excisionase family DNA binding protein
MTAYLSQTDAAGRLGLSRQRISALIKAGKLKAKVIGGRPVISESEVNRFSSIPRKGGRPASKG